MQIIVTSTTGSDFFDEKLVQPDRSLRDLRAHYPRSFITLISLYLKNVEIHLNDLESFVKDIERDEASIRTLINGSSRPPSPITKVLKVCKSIAVDDSKRQCKFYSPFGFKKTWLLKYILFVITFLRS